MRLELEKLEFDRSDTGYWVADFTVRDERQGEVLRFSEGVFAGSKGNEAYRFQEFPADEALKQLFAKARERLKKAAASI